MRLLINGYYGFDNLGDEAILAALLGQLRSHHPDWTPVVMSARPSLTEELYGVPAIARDSLPATWRELGCCDLLISGGGGLLQNVTSRTSLLYYLGVLEMARRRRTPYVILGQGLGPLAGRWAERRAGRYLRRAEAVVVRDADSFRLAQQLGVGEPSLRQAADLALLLEPAPRPLGDNLLQAAGAPADRPRVGLALREWRGHEPWEAAVALCDHLHGEGLSPVLLPFQPQDLALARRIAGACVHPPAVVEGPLAPAEVLAVVGRLELMVAMRLHGLIFAASQQIPALGLTYDPKVQAFCAEAGQRTLSLEQATDSVLQAAAQEVWDQREAGAAQREQTACRLRQAALVNLEVLEQVATGRTR